MAAGENEKEIIELLKNATPGNISKATKYGVKIFQGKSLKTLFWQFKHPSYSKQNNASWDNLHNEKGICTVVTSD